MSRRCCTPAIYPTTDGFGEAAALLRAVADPHRLLIVATLNATAEPVCVCEFTELLPIGQPSVSHHLGILREAGIVVSERRGTWAHYSLVPGVRARFAALFDAIMPSKKRLSRVS